MFYGYGILNNHVPTLKATAMKGGASPFLTSLRNVYKAESNANDSFASNNGTAQGGLTYTTGKSGNAFAFNGTNAYVGLPNNSLNFSSDFTISFWYYSPTYSSSAAIITSLNLSSIYYGWQIYMNNAELTLDYYNGTTSIFHIGSGINFSPNTWYNCVITRKNSTGNKIYVNGTLAFSDSITTNVVNTSTMYCNIGVANLNNTLINYSKNGSLIDELNIWTKQLTPTEITTLYNSGTGKFYPTY